MSLLSVLFLVIWTLVLLVFVRIRAALGVRTLVSFLVLGAVVGLLAVPFATKLVIPYSISSPYAPLLNLMAAIGTQAALVGPVITFLFLRRNQVAVSVIDAFCLAFVSGLGFDLVIFILALLNDPEQVKLISFIPPWVLATDTVARGGFAYWNGLIALTVAAVLRFLRSGKLAIIVGVFAFLYVAIDQAWVYVEKATGYPPEGVLGLFSTLTMHGKLTAWLCIFGVILFGLAETFWLLRTGEGRNPDGEQSGVLKFLNLRGTSSPRRQAEIARTESKMSPEDESLDQVAQLLEIRNGQSRSIDTAETLQAAAGRGSSAYVKVFAPWAVIILLLFLDYALPTVNDLFWSIPLVHLQLSPLPTLLCLFLTAVVVWRFLMGPNRANSTVEPDEVLQFEAERAILQVGLAAAILVFLYPSLESLYQALQRDPWFKLPALASTLAEAYVGQQFRKELATMLLLFVAGATGLVTKRIAAWKLAPLSERRVSVFQNVMRLLIIFVTAWVVLTVYVPVLTIVHQYLAAVLFNVGELVGIHGNTIAAVLVGVMAIVFSIGTGLVLNSISRRLEEFFVGRHVATTDQAPTEAAA